MSAALRLLHQPDCPSRSIPVQQHQPLKRRLTEPDHALAVSVFLPLDWLSHQTCGLLFRADGPERTKNRHWKLSHRPDQPAVTSRKLPYWPDQSPEPHRAGKAACQYLRAVAHGSMNSPEIWPRNWVTLKRRKR